MKKWMQCRTGMAWGMGLLLLAAVPLGAQSVGTMRLTAVGRHQAEKAVPIAASDLQLKIAGKAAAISGVKPVADRPLEVVILLDTTHGSRESMQFDDIRHFLETLGPQAKSAVAYMQNGQAVLETPLTSDAAVAERGLKLNTGPSASPYFCLSDLAKHWPSKDLSARRVVVMVTNGFEPYDGEVYNPSNNYVQQAVQDAVQAGLEVDSIFWVAAMQVTLTPELLAGENYLLQVSDATGGMSYGFGNGSPVSFAPYLADLQKRFASQYEVSFTVPAAVHGKGLLAANLKNSNKADAVTAPQWIALGKNP